ncbi:hypothetical protein DMN91_007937 [Ooceraea biroi]|uniref:Uncharacterized protein n=1 Tax=Ooceraea biroi TaxID=2015173 RepID=A0A3L8DFZ7_OOCBI|nr:hypothetical protein DMN91_007937 [Ooceraea biroi]
MEIPDQPKEKLGDVGAHQNPISSSHDHLCAQEPVGFDESKGKRVRALLTAQGSSHDPFTEVEEDAKEKRKREGQRERETGVLER